ncbi:hypothetical protein AINA4_01530 [Aurantimicrobium sp. INA4]|nr:hypothetical protein AINA4_01530 [Aurantimicrobium sp. INA4]
MKETVPPGNTAFCSEDAAGAAGGVTAAVYVPVAFWFNESVTEYVTAAAVPVKEASGVNVTEPVESTTYVPTPATVNDVWEQFGAVSLGPHNFTLEEVNVVP